MKLLLLLLAIKAFGGGGGATAGADVKGRSGVAYKTFDRGNNQLEVGRVNEQGQVISLLIFQKTGAGNFLVKRTFPRADGPFATAMSDFGVSQVVTK